MKNIAICLVLLLVNIAGFAQIMTEKEVSDFTTKIEKIIKEKNEAKFDALIGTKTFSNKFKSDNDGKLFLEEAIKSAKLSQQIIAVGVNNYSFVKSFNENNKTFLIYRLITEDQGLNYHELELCKENGVVKIADIFIYLTGENLSESLITIYKSLMVQRNKLSNAEEAKLFKTMSTLMPEIKKLTQSGQHEKAYQKILSAPAFMKSLKMFQLNKILVAQNLSDEKLYSDAIDEFKNNYPNAKNLNLLLIDGYLLKKQYDNAGTSIDKLDISLGGDPYLDYYRYLLSNLKNDTTASMKYIEAAGAALPNLQHVQLELMLNLKEAMKEEQLKKVLVAYKANKSFDQNALIETGIE